MGCFGLYVVTRNWDTHSGIIVACTRLTDSGIITE